jgi:hypothetical protein
MFSVRGAEVQRCRGIKQYGSAIENRYRLGGHDAQTAALDAAETFGNIAPATFHGRNKSKAE